MQSEKLLQIKPSKGECRLVAIRTKYFTPATHENNTLLISVRDPETDDYLATLVLEDQLRWEYPGKFSDDERGQIINMLSDYKAVG